MTEIFVYNYNEFTKEYTGKQLADADPVQTKNKGEFVPLVPANATLLEPLEVEEGYVNVFNGTEWTSVENHVGQPIIKLDDMTLDIMRSLGEIDEGYQLLDRETELDFIKNPDKYKVIDGVFKSIVGTDEWGKYLEKEFDKEFIRTSIGAVRINTAWGNFITIKPNYDIQVMQLKKLPANAMILYRVPEDFKAFSSLEELNQWLITDGQFMNDELDAVQYATFSSEILARMRVG